MKKQVPVICVILFLLLLVGCGGIKTNIGDSEKFSEEEIQKSMECTKTYFSENFKDCKLKKMSYNEEKSNKNIESYLTNGAGAETGSTAENTITIFASFHVSKSAVGALEPGEDYDGFMFTLIRDSKTAEWKVVECGY
ncbi:MAG: DUF4829 domain-containing protein [Oscillospiraceae bacterium]